jgi:hypothetical protein
VLDRAYRHARAGHRGDLASPHARGVDHAFGRDLATIGDHGRDAPPLSLQSGHAHVQRERDATGACARGVRVGQARRIDMAVAFDPRRADDAIKVQQRKPGERLARRDEIDAESEAFGHRRRALQFFPAFRGRCDAQASCAVPAGSLSGLGFELSVELGAVTHQLRQVAARAQLPDEARCVPRRAMRQLPPLDHQHVAHTALREVIGDAAADDAAADDGDAAGSGNGHADDPSNDRRVL